jgi:mannose-6-phosphate isomerase
VELLHGRIRDYAWGSRSAIARLQGRPTPTEGPEAELWWGAHPSDPSTVRRSGAQVSLLDLLADDPYHWLGGDVLRRFGPRLPFLMKVLAPESPLSLQAHPDAEQARRGYATESAAGHTGPRNYVDPFHKPEMLVAVSPFEALCGFRDPHVSAEVLAGFGVPALAPVVDALLAGPSGLPQAVGTLLTWPRADRAALVRAVLAAVPAPVSVPAAALARRLAGHYPEDPGVLVALLLNHVRLAPGEAIWMPAGNLHAYLHGVGVEVLAASDNVLRGGFTPKHVDVPELMRVLRFEVLDEPVRQPVPLGDGVVTWPVPVDDFALHGVRLTPGEPVRLEASGPCLVACLAGWVTAVDAAGPVTVGQGQAAVGAADGGPVTLRGSGQVFVASVGVAPATIAPASLSEISGIA